MGNYKLILLFLTIWLIGLASWLQMESKAQSDTSSVRNAKSVAPQLGNSPISSAQASDRAEPELVKLTQKAYLQLLQSRQLRLRD